MSETKIFSASGPRLYGLPSGVDFPAALIEGLRARLEGQPPEAIAQVELYVNTDRMRRRLRSLFDAGPASLLPKIRLVTDLADPLTRAQLPAPVPPLRRRLELTGLVSALLESAPELAPRAALFDLSDSLATLMEEMHGENVPPDAVAGLDVTDQSGHWDRALRFFNIVQQYFQDDSAPDAQAFTRRALALRLAQWELDPPQHPILIAGSTGSRGTTHAFMRAVSRLPQGAVILPGFDTDMPQNVWEMLNDPLTGEDHPQYRFAKLMRELDLNPSAVRDWAETKAPAPERNRVVSLALRPAPVTHQWLSEGPKLPDLPKAMEDVTLLEAPSLREEALAIALRLRQAAIDGTEAALITPDRMLTRQVTSALNHWGIVPDDSAGIPAQLTPPGRFLRLVADLFTRPLAADLMLSLLKHPLCHKGKDRGQHLLNTRDLELSIRRDGMPYPTPETLAEWGTKAERPAWAEWIAQLCTQHHPAPRPLSEWVDTHLTLAEALVAGPDGTPAPLWDEVAGRRLRQITETLRAEAENGTAMSARDYADLFQALLSREEVRNPDTPHPRIRIWGTLEARVAGPELLILAGLNEGSWPESPAADPWLNRRMRAEAGLLLPERRIGLSAHDFQQAVAAPQVWLTRAMKSDDAETVPSRWINRLVNLMNGLPDRHGEEALTQMRDRAKPWLALARASEAPIHAEPAVRPSPAPPVDARPTQLSVTAIKRLVRDPYAIYANKVLNLKPLDPLMQAPDALMRGILTHKVIEDFIRETVSDPAQLTPERLREIAATELAQIPFPTVRTLWQARVDRFSGWFVASEAERRQRAAPQEANFEITGQAELPMLGFTLTGTADRIDMDARGGAHVYDYKTGGAPTESQQKTFDKQLLLEAAMLLQGAFPNLKPRHIAAATYIQLKPGDPKEIPAPLDDCPPDQTWAEFTALIAAYMQADKGYTARRALMKDTDHADYDHLSRFGEWDVTAEAKLDPLT
ncbi:double-strand break repair protein AddB [Sagittula sp. NFXS13]|uniref:double-strand break repair protein AddB n=1 Tax=Sagittula sp. NFXS13 TaxID=2819095 RepID=UPI0032DFD8FD